MKIQLLVASTIFAVFATTSASAGKLVIETTNTSTDAIAVGGERSTYLASGYQGTPAGTDQNGNDERALAGSVIVNANGAGCGCKRKVTVTNSSTGALAVGKSASGSTVINL